MRKKVAWLLALIILMAIGIIIGSSLKKQTEEVKQIENTATRERTNEEYVSIFLENREDFDYVAEIMQQWPDGSYIDFNKDGISSENQEITKEILTNKEFNEHLMSLYEVEEVRDIIKWGEWTEFSFRKPPKDYHGGFYYWENTEEGGLMKTEVIDEHWTLEMLPNV